MQDLLLSKECYRAKWLEHDCLMYLSCIIHAKAYQITCVSVCRPRHFLCSCCVNWRLSLFMPAGICLVGWLSWLSPLSVRALLRGEPCSNGRNVT